MGSWRALVLVTLAIGGIGSAGCKHHDQGDEELDGGNQPADACTDLQCFIVDCGSKGAPPTSVSGTVYAPNGTLPLYGVTVYVPASDPGPLPAGVQCDRCSLGPLGGSLAQTRTDEAGRFMLENVPATGNVPVVIQVGKWRKQLVMPNVAACQDTPLTAVETTLPKTQMEGDIPQIAITTGGCDALECLLRKLGIDDSEFTGDTGNGRVHMFAGTGGANQFRAGFPGGSGAFPNATTLWGTVPKLSAYDIVLMSCECSQYPATKPQSAMQAIHDYAGLGGRIFMSHWQNIWIGGENGNPAHGLADWEAILTFDYGAAQPDASQLTIVDQTVPKGMSYADWLFNVGASPVRGEVTVNAPRYTAQAVDPAKGERWIYVDPARSNPMGRTGVQDSLFTTPNDVDPDQRCGKVVFSDMHVASGSSSSSGTPFPNSCSNGPLTPQEKALAFIFFDIASCVGVLQ